MKTEHNVDTAWRIFITITLSSLFLLGSLTSCQSPEDSSLIAIVLGGKLAFHSNETLGQAVDSFFENPRWSVQRTEDGGEYVTVEGGLTFSGKPVKGALQFTVTRKNGTFKARSLELNGIPQNETMIVALMQKMYEQN